MKSSYGSEAYYILKKHNFSYYIKKTTLKVLKNSLLKNLGIYTFLNLLNSSIPFLLLPILTKYLSTYDYGVVDMFINLNFILLPILGLNVGSSIIRFYYLDNIDFRKTISVVISCILLLGTALLIILSILVLFFNINFLGSSVPKHIILLSFIYVIFSQLIEVLLNVWRAEEKATKYGVLRITKTALDLGLSIYCIVLLKYGWEGRVYPILITNTLLGVLSLVIINKKFNFKINLDKSTLKVIFAYALPLIFHSLGGYLIGFSDRFLILYFLDVESVGVYSVAYQVGMIMSFVSSSFNQAYSPFLFSKLKKNDIKIVMKLKKLNKLYFVFTIILAGIIYCFVPFIYENLIDNDFHVSPMIVFWVLAGYAFNGMYKIIVNYLFYFKQTKSLAYITVFSAIINIIFCVILIPLYGILGASISTTIAFVVMFLMVYIKYKKLNFNETID